MYCSSEGETQTWLGGGKDKKVFDRVKKFTLVVVVMAIISIIIIKVVMVFMVIRIILVFRVIVIILVIMAIKVTRVIIVIMVISILICQSHISKAFSRYRYSPWSEIA